MISIFSDIYPGIYLRSEERGAGSEEQGMRSMELSAHCLPRSDLVAYDVFGANVPHP